MSSVQNKIVHRFIRPASDYEENGIYFDKVIPIDTQAFAYYPYNPKEPEGKHGLFFVFGDGAHTYAELRDGQGASEIAQEYAVTSIGNLDKRYPASEIVGPNGTAYLFNEVDGGGSKFVTKDGVESFVGVNDSKDIPGLAAQIYADKKNASGKWEGAKLDVTNGGIYYTVGDKSFAERKIANNEIAVKGDLADKADKSELAKYIPINNDKDGNKSYMANEENGGIIKYIKPDESYAKVTLCDVDKEAVAQIVATNKDKTTFAKIDARKDGICYSKKTGNPNLEEDELVVKKDIKDFATTEALNSKANKADLDEYVAINNNQDSNVSYIANEADGAIMKFIRSDKQYSKVGLWNTENEAGLQLVIAKDEGGKGNDKDIIKIHGTPKGMFYAKHGGECSADEELVTKKDLSDMATQSWALAEFISQEEGIEDFYAKGDADAKFLDKEEAKTTYAVKDDLKKYIPYQIDTAGNIAYMNNEADGGLIKYTQASGDYSKVALCDIDGKVAAQVVATDASKDIFAKLDVRKEGAYYSKHTGDPSTDEELVVKSDVKNLASKDDLKKYTEIKLEGENGTAQIFNEKDGGGAKFVTNDGIESFVGVNDGKSIPGLYAQIYCDKQVDGKWQGAKIDITNSGMYYTVGDKSFNERAVTENEIATVKLINDLKTQIQELTARVAELESKQGA